MKHFVIEVDGGFVRVITVTRESIYAGPSKDYAYYRAAGSDVDVYGLANNDAFYTQFELWLRRLTAPEQKETTQCTQK